MAEIRLSGVNKIYPGGTHAVHDVNLHIADGEFMIMVGPSGCAKSTILRMIAGLEVPTTGTVEIGGRVVNDVAPKDRDIAMVFQSYALYPHMTVRDNMAFGLKLRNMPQGEIDQRVAEAARILGLEQLLDRLPKAMSGGQRQRVAMGRAIVREPQAFLMDEPLSNLDAKLRVQMRTEIAKLHQRLQTTTVYVTHDQVEAMTLGQRICILRTGVVQQVDTPFQVYQNPANVFVGGFIGSPGMNFMEGHLLVDAGVVHLQLGDRVIPLAASVAERLLEPHAVHGRNVMVGIRPEHLSMTSAQDPYGLTVDVDLTEAMGAEVYAYFTAAVRTPDLSALNDTQATSSTFVARLNAGDDAVAGAQAHLRFDLDELHLFDPATHLTMLAPVDELHVRARRSGPVVTPTTPLTADVPVVGTIGATAHAMIASVFDQTIHEEAADVAVADAGVDVADSHVVPLAAVSSDDVAPRSRPRGFAPRVVGSRRSNEQPTIGTTMPSNTPASAIGNVDSAEAIGSTIDASAPKLAVTDAALDTAIDRLDAAAPAAPGQMTTGPGLAPSISLQASPMDGTSAFRATLARVRNPDASVSVPKPMATRPAGQSPSGTVEGSGIPKPQLGFTPLTLRPVRLTDPASASADDPS